MKPINIVISCLVTLLIHSSIYAQTTLNDSCKLVFGINLNGITDYATELPFVDLMKNCREWYTKDANNPNGSEWNTEAADSLTYRPDGYPTHIPQVVAGHTYQQQVATVWGWTEGWESGQYAVLFDGTGTLDFWGGFTDLVQTSPNRYTFNFNFSNENGHILEMIILSSAASDPVHNIRIMKCEYESTYQTQPFNPHWISKLLLFKSVRFMDWGSTNNFGLANPWEWETTKLYNWSERSVMNYYTWTHSRGIPYEMMVKLMNDYDLDGWVCVPHNASNDYIQNMAQFFHDNLEPQRTLTVEYSNETWNWMFGQTQWLYHYGCELQGVIWPEGIAPYIQNCLDIWTNVYQDSPNRIIRTIGLQTGWVDVSNRIVTNVQRSSFDAIAPTFYFGLCDSTLEAQLDQLGANATVADVAWRVRQSRRVNEMVDIQNIKTWISDKLNAPMRFYEGGQHITPTPFGVKPTYEQALLDIQRDTAMYNLYNEWFDFLRTIQTGSTPLQCMHFSFIGSRSAQYGSWGILETMYQDTSVIYAPKYKAVTENIFPGCFTITSIDNKVQKSFFELFPNPTCESLNIRSADDVKIVSVAIYNLNGVLLHHQPTHGSSVTINVSNLPESVYIVSITTAMGASYSYKVVRK